MVFDPVTFIEGLWFILPAYAANGLVTLAKGRHPVDGGRLFIDRKPLFGPGKTWEGLLWGTAIGTIIAVVMLQLQRWSLIPWEQFSEPLHPAAMSIPLGLLLGFGAMAGDLAGSFLKRRLNIARGRPAPLLDQVDFLLGAFLFGSLAVAINVDWLLLFLILTPLFHVLANVVAYKLRIKDTFW